MLIVLLKEFFRKTALLRRKVEQLAVVETAIELVGQQSGDIVSAASYLATHGYDYLLIH